jgi:hydroxymethylpyrimidine pyrophosphatase-like HAD family hydrolase
MPIMVVLGDSYDTKKCSRLKKQLTQYWVNIMRYQVLACDFDGTLATEGKVAEATLTSLAKLLSTGRKLILVTGRELDDLLNTFKDIKHFHRVVAENGAIVYNPATQELKTLAAPLPDVFLQALQKRGIQDLSSGRVIISTHVPHEKIVIEVIRELGLELHTVFNREAVMILPANVNKATGLKAALSELNLSPHEVVAIGDAENDHAFLELAEFSAAVANALPALKENVDYQTLGDNGSGVTELIEALIADDLQELESKTSKHRLVLGLDQNGSEFWLSARGPNVLITGPSGGGKSTAATSLIERFQERHYQFCIIDPEGDYEGIPDTVTIGRGGRPPTSEEVIEILANPNQNLVVNLLGLPVMERPLFFLELLPRLHEMRANTNRPHWLIVDEAHHLLPASWEPNRTAAAGELERTAMITVHPDQISPALLHSAGVVMAVGKNPISTLELVAKTLDVPLSIPSDMEISEEMSMIWPLAEARSPFPIRLIPSKIERQRHGRKYAIGELPPDRSFYFRGPEAKLNLRAHNLHLFLQIADGIDRESWLYHLLRNDYSRWFRDCIKDDELATEAESIENQQASSADNSLQQFRELIERIYMPIQSPPLPVPGTDAESVRLKSL